MDIYLKVTAGVLLATIVTLVLARQNSDISLLLTILVSCMAVIVTVNYMKPVINFLERLVDVAEIEGEIFRTLLKTAGIGLISQFACMICADAGNQTLAKTLQFVTTAVILYLCVPLLNRILVLIETVLGSV